MACLMNVAAKDSSTFVCVYYQARECLIHTSGGSNKQRRTWIHPGLAIDVARWVSPNLAVQIVRWTVRFLSGDPSLIKDLQDQVDRVHGTRSIVSYTMLAPDKKNVNLQHVHTSAVAEQTKILELQRKIKKRRLVNTREEQRISSSLSRELGVLGVSEETDATTMLTIPNKKQKGGGMGTTISKLIQPLTRVDHLWAIIPERETLEKDVYFIRMDDTQYVKIGFSGDVFKRLKQLSTGNPVKLVLEYKFRTCQYRLHESQLHVHFNTCKVYGEWFELPLGINYAAIVKEICTVTAGNDSDSDGDRDDDSDSDGDRDDDSDNDGAMSSRGNVHISDPNHANDREICINNVHASLVREKAALHPQGFCSNLSRGTTTAGGALPMLYVSILERKNFSLTSWKLTLNKKGLKLNVSVLKLLPSVNRNGLTLIVSAKKQTLSV